MTDRITLTVREAFQLERARGEYARIVALYHEELSRVDAARQSAAHVMAEVLKRAGVDPDGSLWEIREDSEDVVLVRREEAQE